MRAANGFDPARSGRVPVFRKPVPPSPGFGQRAVPHSISHLYHYTIEAQPHATQRAFERYNKNRQRDCAGGFSKWSGLRGSNSLPPPWQGGALPDELKPHGASDRNRTNDTGIFSPLLYRLSYRGLADSGTDLLMCVLHGASLPTTSLLCHRIRPKSSVFGTNFESFLYFRIYCANSIVYFHNFSFCGRFFCRFLGGVLEFP